MHWQTLKLNNVHSSQISRLEDECHGLKQQLEELRMFTSMLERREAERVEVRHEP